MSQRHNRELPLHRLVTHSSLPPLPADKVADELTTTADTHSSSHRCSSNVHAALLVTCAVSLALLGGCAMSTTMTNTTGCNHLMQQSNNTECDMMHHIHTENEYEVAHSHSHAHSHTFTLQTNANTPYGTVHQP